MDQRDAPTWISIELTRSGEERVQDGTIADQLRKDLGVGEDFPVFIPAVSYPKEHRRVTVLLMEGYVFLGSGLPETKYFALESQPYVNQVLSSAGGQHNLRTLVTISDAKINELRQKMRTVLASTISVGDKVNVLEGQYRRLEGHVEDIVDDDAVVVIMLRSLEVVATIPKVFLEPLK